MLLIIGVLFLTLINKHRSGYGVPPNLAYHFLGSLTIAPKTAFKIQGVPHAQTAKHALYHHPRQLSA